MGITLFQHNEDAYKAALSLFAETGKAAIIHPTGTGKSFIAFKLCEDFPDKTICWLSPSEYIFKTQIENLKAVSDGYEPENIVFLTYAKLMGLDENELKEISPDYIVLDEFHRCGAEMWGKGVSNLLDMYPDVPILGLSATAIRYLDNQRDMADELFDGNIASEMTLGEAIVRGILNPPKYVLSLFSYETELWKYRRRIDSAKNKLVRDKAEKYFEALRRAIDKADGLDEIFYRNMTDKHGKYIAFCQNAEHMRDMIGKVPEWFGKIDADPHVYSVYSDDPETDGAFKNVKADDSDHLRILFCIDMLNEGVHVENISGVILFRPTVSPIIYKQQIGRALSASKSKEPIIFDVVNNIENLYSINAVENEIQTALLYYRASGEDAEIINERFKLIDEVRDCRLLFEQLEDTLTASWDFMYGCAKEFYEKEGHLIVPKRYKTPEGYSLGTWIYTQRQVRRGECFGRLDDDRIAKLDAIGMDWDSRSDRSWNAYYAELVKYKELFGNINVPATYKLKNGILLGSWLANLRTYRKNGFKSAYLTNDRIDLLDKLGMVWNVTDYVWQTNFSAAAAYYFSHGDLDVPLDYVTSEGIKLGRWIYNVRMSARGKNKIITLSDEMKAQLDEIGMIWEGRNERQWSDGITEARKYFAKNGNLNVPATYVCESGYRLGRWVGHIRDKGPKSLTASRKAQLDDMGMIWNKENPWEVKFALCKQYFEEHGNLNVPAGYVVNGVWLNKWINEQKQAYQGKRAGKYLTPERVERLAKLGVNF